ncbi:hypothetical protein AMTR_s00037p00152420 [Amborella trichopoda]|uniref:Uncharacterized protein n=1 Tax=Amborella trichopoda TaxID=13333 RepID=U5CVK2_AMBTC|nr:hypothetical protein AMTR_s00037p00152420 [Amborella trichopoda]
MYDELFSIMHPEGCITHSWRRLLMLLRNFLLRAFARWRALLTLLRQLLPRPMVICVDGTEVNARSEGMKALLRSDEMPALSPIRASFGFSRGASTDDITPRGDDTHNEETIANEHLTYLTWIWRLHQVWRSRRPL